MQPASHPVVRLESYALPTVWLSLTILIYAAARRAHAAVRTPLLNPALVSIASVILLLSVTHTPYGVYASGGRALSMLLGPAIVALGVPLSAQLPGVRRNAAAIAAAIVSGSLVGIAAAVLAASLLNAPPQVVASLAPRSATTPIAMAISAGIGGIPALSAAVSIGSGLVGGVIGPELLRSLGVRSRLATGLALGAAAHGLGTARAAEEGSLEGGAGGMAMGLNGIMTAVLVPLIMSLIS